MWFWMGLCLLQVVALPGFLVTRALRLDGQGVLQTALLSFGLSLVVNHFLVLALVLGGVYTRGPLVAVVLAELALLAWLGRNRREPRPDTSLGARIRSFLGEEGEDRGARAPLLAVALATIGFLSFHLTTSYTRVFQLWDSIVSWNRWATDWSEGLVPSWMMHYPQLLPTSWSLAYVFQGEGVQFVPHGQMAIFPVALALVLLDLGLRRRSPVFLLAIPVLALLLTSALSRWIGSGHADIPVAFMGLLAVYPLLWSPLDPDSDGDVRRLVAAGAIAGGAALTKQAGIYVACMLPVLTWIGMSGARPGRRLRACALVAGIAAVLAAPWYVNTELRVAAGIEGSEIAAVTGSVHQGRGPVERAMAAPAHLGLPPLVLAVMAGLALLSLARSEARWLTLLIALPFTVIWAFLFSYGPRNLSIAFPFLALAIAGGLWLLAERVRESGWIGTPGARAVVAAVGAMVLLWQFVPNGSDVVQADRRQRYAIGDRDLNERLLAFQRDRGIEGRVLTNYRHFWNLPEIRDSVFVHRAGPASEFWPFRTNAETFSRIVEDPVNDIRYLLMERPIRPDIARYVRRRVREGGDEVVFSTDRAWMVRVAR